jgi:hypothetical protein
MLLSLPDNPTFALSGILAFGQQRAPALPQPIPP